MDKRVYTIGTEILRTSVLNVPLEHDKYVVARLNRGELWYWGSYNSLDRAKTVAIQVNGVILE